MTGFYQQLLGNGLSKTKAFQEVQKSMILGKVKVNADGDEKAILSINGTNIISSTYGKEDIKKNLLPSLDNPNKDKVDHPYYWTAFNLIGNPW